jgi:hypothetical protein
MDATTVLAVICSGVVFAGWLFLPHSPAPVKTVAVSEELAPVAISA